jgi:hypothetical protein
MNPGWMYNQANMETFLRIAIYSFNWERAGC